MDKYEILKSFSKFLDKHFGETKQEIEKPTVEVVKALDTEKRMATFVVLKAMRDESDYDAHGDFYDRETVEEACYNFAENCMKANLGHLVMVDEGTAKIVENYIVPVDITLGDQDVPAGSWLQTWKFADDSLWADVKAGKWNGLSVGCMANVEVIDE
jgi:hypothetical protein